MPKRKPANNQVKIKSLKMAPRAHSPTHHRLKNYGANAKKKL